jgi:amidase
MSGYTTGDPYWLPEPAVPFLAAARQSLPQLRIAFAFTVASFPVASPIGQQGVRETVQRLEAMGHLVEPACPDCEELLEPFKRVWQAGAAASSIPPELLSPLTQWLAAQAGSAGDYLRAVQQMQVISRRIVAFFEKFEVLVLPVYLHQPMRVGEWGGLSPDETVAKIVNWVAPCPPFNACGLPAIALPVGFDHNGLPFGIQLVGRPAAEATLIALAAQLEAANPLPQRPPLFV